MIQGSGLEVPGDAVQFFGNLARFGFADNWLGNFGADAIYWRMSNFYKLGFAGCEVTNLREFAHYACPLSGLVKGPKPLINSLHAPSSGRFNLRDFSARRGVVLYAYRTHTDSALTSIPSGAILLPGAQRLTCHAVLFVKERYR